MSRYSLSTERLLSLIPTPLRSDSLVRLMMRLLTPVSYIHMLFTLFREKKEYRLAHTSQVFSLTQVICEFCGNNGCYIADGDYIDEVMIPHSGSGELVNYQAEIPSDVSVTPAVTVPYNGLMQTAQNDFVVHLPQELYGSVNESALRTLINEYKLAGKFYGIVYDDVTVEPYSFAWTNHVCQQVEQPVVESFSYSWSGPVCALDATYSYVWSGGVCVKLEITEPYSYVWSEGICIKLEITEPYSYVWSKGICVKTEITI